MSDYREENNRRTIENMSHQIKTDVFGSVGILNGAERRLRSITTLLIGAPVAPKLYFL